MKLGKYWRRSLRPGSDRFLDVWVESFPVDISDRGDSYVVAAVLPGLDQDDVAVRVEGQTVTIEADFSDTPETDRFQPRESVSRDIELSEPVSGADATASYEDGILAVTLQKRSEDR